MANLNLSTPRVFQCPACGEFINTAMTECKFCGVAVDAEASTQAAEVQAKVGNACSDGSYLKISARAIPVAYAVSFIPLIGGAAGWAWVILMILTPILFVRWWMKYPGIQTNDADYKKAKASTWVSIAIWGAMIVVWLLVSALLAIVLRTIQ
ncbi:MAG: hypothetical protein JST84_11215 [Acidobacteria bacterium]|nr:hypothetical protein [Acidobacteriota bacterium]